MTKNKTLRRWTTRATGAVSITTAASTLLPAQADTIAEAPPPKPCAGVVLSVVGDTDTNSFVVRRNAAGTLTVNVTVALVRDGPVATADVSNVVVFCPPRAVSRRTHRLGTTAHPGQTHRAELAAAEDEDHIYRGEN